MPKANQDRILQSKNNEGESENKKEYVHSFSCHDCQFRFSFNHIHPDVRVVASEIRIACPKCGKVWGDKGSNIINKIAVSGLGNTMTNDRRAKLRRENAERSIMAQRQAAVAREEYNRENPVVEVKRSKHMGAPTQYGRAVESVPKKVLDSLEQKATPNKDN